MTKLTEPTESASTDSSTLIRQLQRSERGTQALRDLYAFLRKNGNGLDIHNQRAVLSLICFEFGGNHDFMDWGDIHLAEGGNFAEGGKFYGGIK